jgi:hypothetical protein
MMSKTVVTVLRSGGEFKPEHVQAMQRQVMRWAPPGTMFKCLSDIDIPGVECLPLRHDWPGWWSKLELFRPDLEDDFLFTDLDNVIVGPMDDLFAGTYQPVLQRNGWTALMWLPKLRRYKVWEQFIDEGPRLVMDFFAKENRPVLNGVGNYGDAGFISQAVENYHEWETVLPGQVINIVSLRLLTPLGVRWVHNWPKDTRMILCGGPQHRPWTMQMFWKYRLYGESI